MVKLRQFHLQFALKAARTLRKNIENQAGAVDHPALQALFQIALLHRRQFMIKNNELRLCCRNGFCNLIDFALACIQRWIGPVALATHDFARFRACAGHQQLNLCKTFGKVVVTEIQRYDYRLVGAVSAAARTIKHPKPSP